MKVLSSATPLSRATFFSANAGIGWGCLAVVLFSLSFPVTKIAVGGFSSVFVATGRACIAAVLAALLLRRARQPLPKRYWFRISLVAVGIVLGFPLLTAYAVLETGSAHTAVLVSLLPIATAVLGVVLGGERPSPAFWASAGLGLLAVIAFALVRGGGGFSFADGITLVGIALGALGYAEGAALSRELGPKQVISWAVVAALPISLPVAVISLAISPPTGGADTWGALAYLGIVSMYLGFLAWYRALAVGGVARISQLQLAQPILTLGWSVLLLGEHVGLPAIATASLVLISVVLSQRARVVVPSPRPRPIPGLPYDSV